MGIQTSVFKQRFFGLGHAHGLGLVPLPPIPREQIPASMLKQTYPKKHSLDLVHD